jgi:hypothetical protein
MTPTEQRDVLSLVHFYDKRGWDWSNALEFLVRKYNGSLEVQWRYWNVPLGYKPRGRPRKEKA